MQPAGVSVGYTGEPVNTMGIVNIRNKKNREEKCIKSYNINFSGGFISIQMAQIFLGICTHNNRLSRHDNCKSFKVYKVSIHEEVSQDSAACDQRWSGQEHWNFYSCRGFVIVVI